MINQEALKINIVDITKILNYNHKVEKLIKTNNNNNKMNMILLDLKKMNKDMLKNISN